MQNTLKIDMVFLMHFSAVHISLNMCGAGCEITVFLTVSVVRVWVGGYSGASMGAVGAMHHGQLKSRSTGIYCGIIL